ncbi:major facilitator superfamily transporter [Hyaloscypha variabilis F]|uniref:Major facilitator superfamily transporter n=1 Tax=Hyaloscypha variabilis (strain UAMH 11265 / GT02V1 / F) TaxID=1149755 RepID=A0A2J6RCG5_HYAVF|nr:major facilitator superfamily transporter [Hyaloscypha variabilis F]
MSEPTTSQEGGSQSQQHVDERTPLLSPDNGISDHEQTSPDSTTSEDGTEDTDIDPNEFDNLLSRAESITTGLGIEVESQETAMLRGPRRYSFAKVSSRDSSRIRSRRKSLASTIGSTNDALLSPSSEEDAESKPKSPFLAGVSVSTFWLIFSGVLTGNFVACFDSTIMVSSHPVITSYFQSSNSASWLSTAFLLTSTSFQPLFGRLSDTIGRKTPYVFSTTVFLLATLWCALAQSMTSFILARAVCGLGAGGMLAMGSIITSDLVPIEIRGVYQSYINIVFGFGSAMGAALGGAIADSLGWRWEFGVQVPFIALCVFASYFTIPRKLGLAAGIEKKSLWEAMKVFDFKGSLLLTSSITFLILGLNLGGNIFPWTHPIVLTSLIIFSVAFPLFIYTESFVALPIMPLTLILNNPRAGLILGNFIGAIIANAVTFNIPLYFQAVLLESATTSGLRLIVPSVAASAVGTATGFLIVWTKRLKWLLVLGVICLTMGTVALSLMQRGLPDWAYLFFLVPSAMGQGFMFPATFMSVLAVSEQAEQAVVTSTLILWRSLGMVLGVATSSLVVQNALYIYLEKNVIGPDKEDVIQQVRKSVRAIAGLEPVYREQVIDSYASALKANFIMTVGLSLVVTLMTLFIKLPRLGQRK